MSGKVGELLIKEGTKMESVERPGTLVERTDFWFLAWHRKRK